MVEDDAEITAMAEKSTGTVISCVTWVFSILLAREAILFLAEEAKVVKPRLRTFDEDDFVSSLLGDSLGVI